MMETSNDKRITALRERIATLSPAKRGLLERALKGESPLLSDDAPKATERASNSKLPPPQRLQRADHEPPPLSFTQQGMWLLYQTLPDPATYNSSVAWRLSGLVDRERVRRSLHAIMARHEVLRTALVQEGQNLSQRIFLANELPLPWQETDLQNVPADQRSMVLDERLLAEARHPFDLAQAPLWRVSWIQLSKQEQVLAFTFHHSIVDEWSLRIFFQELERLYAAEGQWEAAGLPKLPRQYADYATWQRERLTGEFLKQQRVFWQEQLRDLPPALELPKDCPRPARPSGCGADHHFQITGSTVARFRELAREENTTLFAVMLAAFYVWLYRYTGQDDIVIGTPITGRHRPEFQALIGFFLNTLPIRLGLEGNKSFREVVRQVRNTLLEAFSHAELPFEQMVELAVKGRDANQQPLYQVMFVLLEEGLSPLRLNLAEGRPLPMSTRTSKNDFTWSIHAGKEVWNCRLEYATDLFSAESAARMGRHLSEILTSISEDTHQPISRLRLMSEKERQQLLVEWNRTEREYPRDKCLHQLFEEQVARTPEAVAVVFENERLTYRELNMRANQLAHHLRSLGVRTETLVGICVERSLEMVVGPIGILKAGGAYVPMDPSCPEERLALILEDSRIPVLLTQTKLSSRFAAFAGKVMRLDALDLTTSNQAPPPTITPLNLAYVIYTSGSTGKPKGVMITHRGLVNYLTWAAIAYKVADGVGAPVHSSISFDLTITGLFTPLLVGRHVHMVNENLGLDGLSAMLRKAKDLSLVKVTPAHLDMVRTAITPPEAAGRTHAFIIGGEALQGESVSFWQDHAPNTVLVNEYGPTETVVGCCVYFIPRERRFSGAIPIGRPIANIRLYVLDQHFQPVPIGVKGELCISGDGVARGYLNRPELTAERFLPDPFSAKRHARMYRTGDIVRWLPDGCLEFLGRTDDQVKLRGYRIELGEIAAALNEHPAIKHATVWAREDVPGNKRLVAYIVASEGSAPPAGLREFLRNKLPDYMVPAVFVTLKALPLTPNGKIDRRALPKPDSSRSNAGEAFMAPRNPVEEVMAQIFQEVLKVEKVSVEDNFFELGGHSLLATQVSSRVRQTLEVDLPLRLLFESPTVAALASSLLSTSAKQADLEKRAELLLKVAKLSESEAEVLLSGG